MPSCEHFDDTEMVPVPDTIEGCEDCLVSGDTWVHLRLCLECGHIGCCDSSRNRHARAHSTRHRHAIVRSVEPGETWGYCYVDDLYTDLA